jgi:hypothetical protein
MIKPPTGPFWIWTDLDGNGEAWRLAHLTPGDTAGEWEIHYPIDDFDDYFYPEEWSRRDIRVIRQPKPKDE